MSNTTKKLLFVCILVAIVISAGLILYREHNSNKEIPKRAKFVMNYGTNIMEVKKY